MHQVLLTRSSEMFTDSLRPFISAQSSHFQSRLFLALHLIAKGHHLTQQQQQFAVSLLLLRRTSDVPAQQAWK